MPFSYFKFNLLFHPCGKSFLQVAPLRLVALSAKRENKHLALKRLSSVRAFQLRCSDLLWLAFSAAAAFRLDKLIKIIFSVMICYLFGSLNPAFGDNPYFAFNYFRISIRATRMVDIASRIAAASAVNRVFVVEFEKVASRVFLGFIVADALACVLNNFSFF